MNVCPKLESFSVIIKLKLKNVTLIGLVEKGLQQEEMCGDDHVSSAQAITFIKR